LTTFTDTLVASEVPPTPDGKNGWPWHAETIVPPATPDRRPWPRWTVVIPSFNQGRYIEETIRSVLMQGYPDLELIIIDGGSTDETVDVIRRYEPFIRYWESCSDRGQTHAINKGFSRATGEVLSWVNSDDLLAPGAAFAAITQLIADKSDVVGGAVRFFGEGTQSEVARVKPFKGDSMVSGRPYVFHVSFFRASAVKKCGALREDLHYAMDYEYLVRLSRAACPCSTVDQVLSHFRVHEASKTCAPGRGFECYREMSDICRSYGGSRFNYGYTIYWRHRLRDTVERSRFAFALRAYRVVKKAVITR
jgi:glycosyltransferase involved in cell wall biosynthesis